MPRAGLGRALRICTAAGGLLLGLALHVAALLLSPLFRLLVALRRLRGTALDPFGYAKVRRIDRGLVSEYRAMVERTLRDLGPEGHERAVRIARLPDLVRGYEEVRLRNVERFRAEARALGAGI